MKKNVFSRTIAVLASMTVLGAATMLSASAIQVEIAEVEVEQGATKVELPVYVTGINGESTGFSATFIAPTSPEIFGSAIEATDKFITEGDLTTGFYGVFVDANGYKGYDKPATTLTIPLDPDAEPGRYPIEIEIETLDENGEEVVEPQVVNGAIIIKEAETEPTTEAPTAAPTTAATTAAATTTTAKKGTSPKTGSTGVAVAVAGLVTAGATAVVLKKKH